MVAAKLIDIGAEGRQRIDRYELVAEIASGGMATVYLARLSGVGGFQRFVAIKRLHPHLAHEKEFVEMFLDEARLAAGIHHPNVVPILEVGASDRGYYLVMEYIEGDTLARFLARAATLGNKLPVKIALRVILDMLAGLHAAHELRDDMGHPTELVHRDVSPQNVLVGTDGISRISDFGVARAASRLTATRTGQLKGKIAYMAPEQAMGKEAVDRRADVFSSGIMLWEVLAARRLFKAENESATLSRVISEPITKLSTLAPDVSPQISAVCMKALERDPNKRFATCSQFADALESAAAAVDKIASGREVSTYVSEVLGQEISQQRDAVRAWLARSEPSQVAPADMGTRSSRPRSAASTGAAALTLPHAESSGMTSHPSVSGIASMYPEAPRSKRLLVAVAAGLASLLAGASIVLLWSPPNPEPAGAASLPPKAAEPVPVAPLPSAESPGTAVIGADAPAGEPSQLPAVGPDQKRLSRPRREPLRGLEPRIRSSQAAGAARSANPEKAPRLEKKPDEVNLSNPYR